MISFLTYFILFVHHCHSHNGLQIFVNNQLINADTELKLKSNDTIRLECRFNEIIQWILPNNTEYKDYSNPMDDGRCNIETLGNRSILTITDLRYTDTGLYNCVSNNDSNEDNDESSFSIHMEISAYVFVKDNNPNHLFMHFIGNTITVYKDRESFINCKITDPDAKVDLFIDGDEAKTDFEYDKQKGFRVSAGSLEHLSSLHAMKCVATNLSTNTKDTLPMFLLMIERKPNMLIVNISPDNADKLFYLNNRLNLQCDVANYDLAECNWSYPNATNVREGGGTLFLDSIDSSNNGKYKCICRNHSYPEQIASAEIFGIVRKNKSLIRVNEKGQTLNTRGNETVFYANVNIFVPVPISRDMISAQWFHNYSMIHFGNKSIAVNSFGVNVRILDELKISLAKTDVSDGVNLMNKLLTLTLQNVNFRESGAYSLVVKAGDAVETITFSLVVNSTAVVELYVTDKYSQKRLNSTYLEKDKIYKVWCIAEGIPLLIPDLSFCPCVIDQNELCDQSCIDIKEDSHNGGLQVQNMTGTYQSAIVVSQNATTSGTFKCTVQSSKKDIPFIVTDIGDSQEMSGFSLEMERSAFRHENNDEVYEHDNATIICKIQKYEDKGGVDWYFKRNSESMWHALAVQGLDKAKRSNYSHVYQWSLRNIQLNQSGSYRCSRSRTEPNAKFRERIVKVTRSSKPSERNQTPEKVLHFHYSTNATIVCEAQGVPFPKIKWIKDGEPLNSERHKLSDRNTTITIDTVIAEDEGKYVCTMTNPSGTSTAEYRVSVTGLSPLGTNLLSALFILVLAVVVITCLVVFIITRLALKREIQMLQNLHLCLQNNMDLDDHIDPDKPINAQPGNLKFDSAYSIPASFLDMDNKERLDGGNFGVVFKVPLKSSNQLHVAVKELNKRFNAQAHTALVSEAKIMMYIGDHVNVLSLIGAFITEIPNGIQYIATELCAKGSLSKFLQERRNSFIPENATVVTGQNNPSFADADAPVRYKIAKFVRHLLHKDVDSDSVLATSDLLCLAYQIANGMIYLVSKNIIHRDLAARNILLTSTYLVRIADFGLSRISKVYHAEKSRRFGLPFQHMAPESVNNYEFSTQSDVWSFGILLSEVFSLGSHPFPDLDLNDPFAVAQFKSNLKTGTLKPPIPENTPSALAQLMKKCWELAGANRPDYEKCRSVIEECLKSHCADCHEYLAAALNANAGKTPVRRIREEMARVQSTYDENRGTSSKNVRNNKKRSIDVIFRKDSKNIDVGASESLLVTRM